MQQQPKLEGEHAFLAVRGKAFPHDTAAIPAADFDPRQHELARNHVEENSGVNRQVVAIDAAAGMDAEHEGEE